MSDRPGWYALLAPYAPAGEPSASERRQAQLVASSHYRPPHGSVPGNPAGLLPASFADSAGNTREVADLDDLARLVAGGLVDAGSTEPNPAAGGAQGAGEAGPLRQTAPNDAVTALIRALQDARSRTLVLENDAYAKGFALSSGQGGGVRPNTGGRTGEAFARGVQDGALERYNVPANPAPTGSARTVLGLPYGGSG